jgi:hypothetical protein
VGIDWMTRVSAENVCAKEFIRIPLESGGFALAHDSAVEVVCRLFRRGKHAGV